MNKCEVMIETPVKNELVFDFDCEAKDVRYSVCDTAGFIKLAGPLNKRKTHKIDVSALEKGSYVLKLVDGQVWGDNKFEIS